MRVFSVAFLILISLSFEVAAYDHGDEGEPETSARTMSDTLRVWQSLGSISGFKYEYQRRQEGVGLAGHNIKEILSENPEALREADTFAKYQVPTFFASLISAALGYGLAIDNEGAIYIGVGGLIVSFIFDQIGYSHLKKSVKIYNEGLNRSYRVALPKKS
jgi:hypothetical protein